MKSMNGLFELIPHAAGLNALKNALDATENIFFTQKNF